MKAFWKYFKHKLNSNFAFNSANKNVYGNEKDQGHRKIHKS